jgi:antirestriction protein ArdC
VTADNGDELERQITFMKGYSVFNCEQIDGLPEHYYARPSPPRPCPRPSASKDIKGAERFASTAPIPAYARKAHS